MTHGLRQSFSTQNLNLNPQTDLWEGVMFSFYYFEALIQFCQKNIIHNQCEMFSRGRKTLTVQQLHDLTH